MIATISPADINYEETLSTLRSVHNNSLVYTYIVAHFAYLNIIRIIYM